MSYRYVCKKTGFFYRKDATQCHPERIPKAFGRRITTERHRVFTESNCSRKTQKARKFSRREPRH